VPGTVSAPKARRWPATDGRHAQPRIGVDIGAADEALHQLVGDVIVLGQQLPGEIERDRVRARARDDALKPSADASSALSQSDANVRLLPQHRMQQTAVEPSVSPSAEPFGAEPPKFAGCSGSPAITRAARRPVAQHAAADAAIGQVCGRGGRGAGAFMASIDVLLIAAALLESATKAIRLVGRAHADARHDSRQRRSTSFAMRLASPQT
jgi:hypothetical protein